MVKHTQMLGVISGVGQHTKEIYPWNRHTTKLAVIGRRLKTINFDLESKHLSSNLSDAINLYMNSGQLNFSSQISSSTTEPKVP